MILVDVRLPEFDKTIDFLLNEDARGWDIADEIATMVASNIGKQYIAEKNTMLLYSMNSQLPLNLNYTLRENGIHSGDSLLFV